MGRFISEILRECTRSRGYLFFINFSNIKVSILFQVPGHFEFSLFNEEFGDFLLIDHLEACF